MKIKEIIKVVFVLLLLDGCAFKSLSDTIEGIYTDEVVVKPSRVNYKNAPSKSSKPILRDATPQTISPQEIAKKQSERFNKKGYIQNISYDPDVSLYIYHFKSVPNNEDIVFFYNKKLPYSSSELIEVDIKDNFLMDVKQKGSKPTYQEPTLSQKIKKHKKRKRNYKIHEAIEEKINTL